MNQVLMRSLNTSLAAVLPVLSLLIIGSGILGAVALREFALALLVGLLTGSYSSIFIAAPLLGDVQGARAAVPRGCAAPHATGVELERLVLGGSPDGHRRETSGLAERHRRRATASRRPAPTPSTPQRVLTHPPRPRKKKRR